MALQGTWVYCTPVGSSFDMQPYGWRPKSFRTGALSHDSGHGRLRRYLVCLRHRAGDTKDSLDSRGYARRLGCLTHCFRMRMLNAFLVAGTTTSPYASAADADATVCQVIRVKVAVMKQRYREPLSHRVLAHFPE